MIICQDRLGGQASEHQLAEKNGAIFAAIKAIAAAHGPSISNQQVVMRWVAQGHDKGSSLHDMPR
jgi:hypothetical protein